MPDKYTLTVVNNSELSRLQIAVFAKLPVQHDFGSLNAAWIVAQLNEGNTKRFEWEMSWGFAWSAGAAMAGYVWSEQRSLPADPRSASACATTFDYNGDFLFTPQQQQPDGMHLWINDTDGVPLPSQTPSSVAVSLEGRPVSIAPAGPNLQHEFTLHPTYYIDAGNYIPGQMVDGDTVTEFHKVEFAAGAYALTATLEKYNTWSVAPTEPGPES